jgi:hypothetical protein
MNTEHFRGKKRGKSPHPFILIKTFFSQPIANQIFLLNIHTLEMPQIFVKILFFLFFLLRKLRKQIFFFVPPSVKCKIKIAI